MKEFNTLLCLQGNKDCGEMLQTLLEIEGYRVKMCATSEEALRQALQSSFSAIILDHYFRGIDGIKICREIRASNRTTPIIFYSAAAFPADRKAGLEAGAQAYLVKPMIWKNWRKPWSGSFRRRLC